jgi:two-component system sensor histidine kinase KdpD
MGEPMRRVRSTIVAVACALASAAVAYLAQPYAQRSDLEMIHLLAIVLIAMRFGVAESLVACTVSIISFDFLFIPPHFAFALTDAKSALLFIGMFVVAGVISTLTERMRQQQKKARSAAFQAEALYGLNVELSGLTEARQIAAVTVRHLERLFGGHVAVLFRAAHGGSFEGPALGPDVEHAERAWVRREYTRVDGAGVSAIWIPIVGMHAPLGVVGLTVSPTFPKESDRGFLLVACVNQLATATERVLLANAVHRTELETETERLRNSLLSAVSHDLKTPLASMIAAGTTLLRRRQSLDTATVDGLLADIVGEGERLNELILNLLSVSRLESPTIDLRRLPQPIDEILAGAVGRFEKRFDRAHVRVELEPDLPVVYVEPLLVEQLLWNLFENALRHAGSDVTLDVRVAGGSGIVTVQVGDDGPGVPEHERDKVFEKFYRGSRGKSPDGGVGLGLTICRAIVQAHGGRIAMRESASGGALVEFTLPVTARQSPCRDPLTTGESAVTP